MATLMKRQIEDWEPVRFLREVMNWRHPLMERLGEWLPDFEVKETSDSYLIRGDVPGIGEKDIEISLTGNLLTIAGKREEEKKEEGEKFYTYERSFGSFSRSFALPEGTDSEHIHTELKDGVLTVALPKGKTAPTRKIEVKRAKGS